MNQFFRSIRKILVGEAPEPTVAPSDKVSPRPQPEEKPQEKPRATSIESRDRAVKLLVEAMLPAVGSKSAAIANLVVHIVVDAGGYDPLDYAWADEKLKEKLRVALDNAMLEAVGSRSITLKLTPVAELPESAVEVVGGELFYSWGADKNSPSVQAQTAARISLIEGTGSLASPFYELDSSVKTVYHIGRGIKAVGSKFRVNDIVIRTDDADPDLQTANNHVSSNHADILSREGRFYLKACEGGCRSLQGSPTKLISGESIKELTDTNSMHPLTNGDMIELGKTVTLLFSTNN